MVFYEIDIRSQPKIVFACSTNNRMTEQSRNIIDHREGMLELSMAENTAMLHQCEYDTGQETRTAEEGSISLFMPDCRYTIRPVNPAPHVQLTSIAVGIDDLSYTRHDLAELDAAAVTRLVKGEALLLPSMYRNDPEECRLLLSLMKALIGRFPDKTAAGQYTCLSRWYELCALIDTGFRRFLSQSLAGAASAREVYRSHYHVYKIQKYVRAHLHETIRMGDLAALLQLSPDYVGKLFREGTGYSLSEYIARQRVQELCEQINLHPEEPLAALAARVGLADIRYAQRLFRKHTGVSMSEYRSLGRGMTLYHENPWTEEQLERDIFEGTWEQEK